MTALQWTALRLVALLGLAASAASALEQPILCGFEAECEAVIGSVYGRPAGVPLWIVGILGFGLFFVLSLFPTSWLAKLLGPVAVVAGVAGLGLIVIQAVVLRQFCRLCLVVDICGLLLAILYMARPRPLPGTMWRPVRWLWGLLGGVALAAPWAWTWFQADPPPPSEVRALWEQDKVNVVLVTDFDCSRCRLAHPALAKFLEEHAKDVNFVELVHPMPHNANSRPAARAFYCAKEQGKGGAMSDALFAAADLTEAGCEKLARDLGLDLEAYKKCATSAGLDKKIDDETAWVKKSGARGLPVIWIGTQMLQGVPTSVKLAHALRLAR